jgi:hypothetical protein
VLLCVWHEVLVFAMHYYQNEQTDRRYWSLVKSKIQKCERWDKARPSTIGPKKKWVVEQQNGRKM